MVDKVPRRMTMKKTKKEKREKAQEVGEKRRGKTIKKRKNRRYGSERKQWFFSLVTFTPRSNPIDWGQEYADENQ